MKDARRGKPGSDQLRHAFPCEPVFLVAPPERFPVLATGRSLQVDVAARMREMWE